LPIMKLNTLKAALENGQTVLGTMVGRLNSPDIVPILADIPFDFFVVETEHTAQNPETVYELIAAGRRFGIPPLVRPPGHGYEYLCRPLDWGARGLLVPRVETPEQVREILRCTKYPPRGVRGASLGKAMLDFEPLPAAGEELLELIEQQTIIICMVESRRALSNLEEMAAVPGLDALLIGPFDLTTNLGISGQMEHPLLKDAIKRVAEVCQDNRIAAGIHIASKEGILDAAEAGMRCLMFSNPGELLAGSGGEQVRTIREKLKDAGCKLAE